VGVLLATGVMTLLMHTLLKRVAHLTWGQLFEPQVPALLCAAGATASVLLVEFALRAALGAPSGWLLLMCQGAVAVVFYTGFMLFAPHAGLRALVYEMSTDLAPRYVKRHRWFQWYLAASGSTAGSSPM
jgi:hypothetical protein